MSSREIITIQCGHYSNFVGTHWWNLQESAFCYDQTAKQPKEISTDCTFREGLTLNGEQTYTPRLVALDLSGSLHALKEDGELYGSPAQQQSTWDGQLDTHVTEPAEKNPFLTDLQLLDSGKMATKDIESKTYELHSDVKVWSDFLRIHLHPKSLLLVPGIFHGNKDSRFQTYPAGQGIWDRQFKELFEDRLHFFVEECDSLQGFQLLVDVDDGFGGLGSCLAQELAEEYSQKGVLSVSTSPSTQPLDQTSHFHSTILNHALCLDELCTNSSVVCPLSLLVNPWRSHTQPPLRPLPSVRYEPGLMYHTAALLGAALDTASLIYRVHQPPLTLPAMADILTKSGRKVCGVGSCLPLMLPDDSSLLRELDHTPLHLQLHPLTPYCHVTDERWAQCVSIRGIPPAYPLCSPGDPRSAYCQHHASLALSSHLAEHFPTSSTSSHFTVVHKPLPLDTPFPSMLPQQSREAPCSAAFLSQSGVGDMVTALSSELKRLDIKKMPSYATTCLDCDSYAELQERLVAMAGCYRTKPNLDEPSDSD